MAKGNTIKFSVANSIRFDGIGDARLALSTLKKAVQNRVTRMAMMTAIRPIAREAKRLAPRDSGLLRRAIGPVVRTYPTTGHTVGLVGVRTGFKETVARRMWPEGTQGKNVVYRVAMRPADPAKYVHLVEFGTKPHTLGQGSSLRKQTQLGAAHPGTTGTRFLSRAWDASRGAFLATFNSKLAEGVRRETSKLESKALSGLQKAR